MSNVNGSVCCCYITSNSSWSLCRWISCGVKMNGCPSSSSPCLSSCVFLVAQSSSQLFTNTCPSVRSRTKSGCSMASRRFHNDCTVIKVERSTFQEDSSVLGIHSRGMTTSFLRVVKNKIVRWRHQLARLNIKKVVECECALKLIFPPPGPTLVHLFFV